MSEKSEKPAFIGPDHELPAPTEEAELNAPESHAKLPSPEEMDEIAADTRKKLPVKNS